MYAKWTRHVGEYGETRLDRWKQKRECRNSRGSLTNRKRQTDSRGGRGGGGGVGETEEQGWRMAGKDEEVPAAVSLLSSVFMVIRAIPLTQE
ncbi:hypothetical protein QLX08_009944 [Tetragonisca angustula]|uniref:Uncharacterized protein n=1 Tax=Tetragonisca angustula TaxID=166442 RepID=A0AAW0ZE32_9HYME